ncbi:hypothetical protein EDC61_11418 [Sulfuritortus calidifontis]|uniref:Bacteriophage Rz lysis protein n=1 Tax=Sulfuritortus calidifontis TaxID=1914471 RepID=A0A4R3JTC4_9PROT|nr:hypothetical protein [Sulfuritortus calidifontis]TCS70691.1 hypothetical protein EDC61_11418 [Sulfuritortus calidifontis]
MIPLTTPWPAIAAALVCVGAGFASGYALNGRLNEGRIARAEAATAQCRAEAAESQRRAAEEAAARLAAAQDAERRAVHALHATQARLAATEKRLKESLYALPTAQSCGLSGAARGLLNARLGAAGAGDLPARAAGPAPAAAESAADPGEPVREADLGAWIAEAIGAYDDCRARIDAIRHWDEVTHGR